MQTEVMVVVEVSTVVVVDSFVVTVVSFLKVVVVVVVALMAGAKVLTVDSFALFAFFICGVSFTATWHMPFSRPS